MKTITIILSVIVLLIISPAITYSQSSTEVYAVLNRASWCSICKEHMIRSVTTIRKFDEEKKIKFISNDLSSNATKQASTTRLEKFGIYKVMSEFRGTGMIYFINPKTKKLVKAISMSKDDEEIVEALEYIFDYRL